MSELLANDKISFVVSKPFTSRGKTYAVGDDFPQDETDKIETFVRARYVIPVVDSIEDKKSIRRWHKEIRPKDEVLARLFRENVQLVWPTPPDSMDLETLTYPERTPEPEPEGSASTSEDDMGGVGEGSEYDPGEHTVSDVLDYMETHPDQTDAIRMAEAAGKNRKGIVEGY